jgi:hypothetical protein
VTESQQLISKQTGRSADIIGEHEKEAMELISRRESIPAETVESLTFGETGRLLAFICEQQSIQKRDKPSTKQLDYQVFKLLSEMIAISELDGDFDKVFSRLKKKFAERKVALSICEKAEHGDDYLMKIKLLVGEKRNNFTKNGIQRESRRLRKIREEKYIATLKKEEEVARSEQYAALLAEGRKKQTLQQAYANGDFIPVDEENSVYLPSSTGKRLGAR